MDHLPLVSSGAPENYGAARGCCLWTEMEGRHRTVFAEHLYAQVARHETLHHRATGALARFALCRHELTEHGLDRGTPIRPRRQLREWKEHGHVLCEVAAEPIPLQRIERGNEAECSSMCTGRVRRNDTRCSLPRAATAHDGCQ